MRSYLSRGVAALAWVGLATSAAALDLVQAEPAKVVDDNQLMIGARTLRLPDGAWHYVAKYKGRVVNTMNNQVIGANYRGYAMAVKNGSFQSGVELLLPDASFYTTSWIHEPCKVEGFLFRDDFDSGYQTPECLLVYKRTSHLSRPSGEFYPQVSQWVADQKIKLPGAVYEVTYVKYATNDYGLIRIWVPVKNVAGDDAIIAWARGLPERLRRFAEKRDSVADLPSIPSKD